MKHYRSLIKALIGISSFFLSQPVHSFETPCPSIELHGHKKINLTENEITLICGDPKLESYQDLPAYQIEYLLRGFLQDRGHLNPNFKQNQEKIIVQTGERTYLKEIETSPKAPELEAQVRRFFEDKAITPHTLNEIETFVIKYHRENAIPCSTTKAEFYPRNERLVLTSKNLERQSFKNIEVEQIPKLNSNALKRFQAFSRNQDFDPEKLELTKKRMLRAGIVQNTYFQTVCSLDKSTHKIYQKHNPGPSKSLRFGIGANTEVGPLTRVRWSNQRYKKMASTLSSTFQASLKEQSLIFSSDYYPSPQRPYLSFVSEFELNREYESDYEQSESSVSTKIKWQNDTTDWSWKWLTGPLYNFGSYTTDSNQSERSYNSVAWQSKFVLTDHQYEIFDLYPKKGNQLTLALDIRPQSVGLDYNLAKIDLSYLTLSEISEWGKGSLSAGLRFNLGTTWVETGTNIDSVPTTLRYYGGGSEDYRGQRLKSLPKNNGRGALSKALIRFELRKTHFLTSEFEALFFTDLSKFSENSWELNERLWYSPGIGLRWLSPIGPIQAFAAKSYATNPKRDDDLYLYIGLGGQL